MGSAVRMRRGVVTGAGSGIGKAVATRMLREGVDVLAVDIDAGKRQFARQQVAGNAAVGRIHHPQLPALKAFPQRRQVQAMAGKHRVGFVALQQFTGTLLDRPQHAELVGMREAWLRTS